MNECMRMHGCKHTDSPDHDVYSGFMCIFIYSCTSLLAFLTVCIDEGLS